VTDRSWLVFGLLAFIALSLAGYRSTMQCVGTTCGVVFVGPR
jgi:hypothetical protein